MTNEVEAYVLINGGGTNNMMLWFLVIGRILFNFTRIFFALFFFCCREEKISSDNSDTPASVVHKAMTCCFGLEEGDWDEEVSMSIMIKSESISDDRTSKKLELYIGRFGWLWRYRNCLVRLFVEKVT